MLPTPPGDSGNRSGQPSPEGFAGIESQIDALRVRAAPKTGSWLSRFLGGGVSWSGADQVQFNAALIEAIMEVTRVLKRQEYRLAAMDQQLAALLSVSERLHEVHGRLRQVETQAEQLRDENRNQVEVLRALGKEAHGTQLDAMRNEMQERIQHLLEEQRVCLRQISLRTGEEAVLADRTRRAVELRLEELAQRLAQLKT